MTVTANSVLVVGVYLADRPNTVRETVAELARSTRYSVEQRWLSLGASETPADLQSVTARKVADRLPKFTLLNQLLSDWERLDYEYVIVCDDDVNLPHAFLDQYLALVQKFRFALAQPARTHESFIDHHFVEQLDGLMARRTRFVEIGPVFSIRRDALPLVLPFNEGSPMGWGYDFVWPVLLAAAGLSMGIVDATPVAHRIRKPVADYSHATTHAQMQAYLASHQHLSKNEAFTILESYA